MTKSINDVRTNTMERVFKSETLLDGVQVDIDMYGAPLPCAVYLDPVAGDTLQWWYSPDADKSRMVSMGTVTVYTESAQLTGSVAWIRVQRTAGAGTTSKATVR